MLSRIRAHTSMQSTLTRALLQHKSELQNVVLKRESGHNTMRIKPSPYENRFLRNWLHFYTLIVGIPTAVIVTIINIRANPELIEIPDGYEPRHWEYYKHPISRFIAKHMYYPMEIEHEFIMGMKEHLAEVLVLKRLESNIDKVMKFYNDHRSKYFTPKLGADYVRKGKLNWHTEQAASTGVPGHIYEEAFDREATAIPVEGYKDGPIDGM